MISGLQSTLSSAYGQIQRQQAQNYADQAERRASILRAEADQARAEADRAERQAVRLDIDARQARASADRARGALSTIRAFDQLGERQAAQLAQINRSFQQGPSSSAVTSARSSLPSSTVPYAAELRVGVYLDVSA